MKFIITLFLFFCSLPLSAQVAGGGSFSGGTSFRGGNALVFPNFTYDQWEDFEQCPHNAALTVACLNASDHKPTGGWGTTSPASNLTAATYAQDSVTGAPGNSGYSDIHVATTDRHISWCFNIGCTFTTSKAQITVSFFYHTITCATSFQECAHPFEFNNNAQGNLIGLADEKNSFNNVRDIRLRPCTADTTTCYVTVTDDTSYWISIQYLATNEATQMTVYAIPGCSVVGTATYSPGGTFNVTDIWFGYDAGNGGPYTAFFDDIFFDWTNATYPVKPSTC